jgi:arginine decarboxylase
MEITVVRGVGRGPTELAAYDAALAAAGVHDYNLVTVSSVISADASVRVRGTAPDLGPAGDRLTVVRARASAEPPNGAADPDVTATPLAAGEATAPDGDEDGDGDEAGEEPLVAGLGWATGPGPGLFYEASGRDATTVGERVRRGLAGGRDLREWTFTDETVVLARGRPEPNAHVAAVVVAAYGSAERIGDEPRVADPNEPRQV